MIVKIEWWVSLRGLGGKVGWLALERGRVSGERSRFDWMGWIRWTYELDRCNHKPVSIINTAPTNASMLQLK